MVTHGAEQGGAFRKEGNRASSVSAMLHFIQCRKHSKCIALKTFFIEVKFTSHKIRHLSHLKVYYSHLKCTVLRVFQSDCTTLYTTTTTSTPPLLSFPQLCSSVLLPLTCSSFRLQLTPLLGAHSWAPGAWDRASAKLSQTLCCSHSVL